MDVCQWVEKSKIQLWRVVAFFFCNNVDRIAFAYSYPNFYLFIFSMMKKRTKKNQGCM
ncbi:hypothetical protein CA2015_0763 [Cyclobacterium amurskyense]|uniref:Uncharacterized protein n=1 Tax=Cyclobacterium amurskyense TaxID=320787 RepID=A0A0H4P7T4_9BACT|nr:hypothetical protein CA2015_0763 [Cyclobacterium amurskyense]